MADIDGRSDLGAPSVRASYRFTASIPERELSAAFELLSPAERAACARFAFDTDRRDYAVAHALLRTTLSSCEPQPPGRWRFDTSPSGKPFISAAPSGATRLSFSLSHTRGLVACAVTSGADVGIDVACAERFVRRIAVNDEVFSQLEVAQLERCGMTDRPLRFAELWALKEAFLKATGEGLSLPCSEMTFDLTKDDDITFTPPLAHSTRTWQCALFALGSRHRLALVVGGAPVRDLDLRTVGAESGSTEPAVLIRSSS